MFCSVQEISEPGLQSLMLNPLSHLCYLSATAFDEAGAKDRS